MTIKLILGLQNPGSAYEQTRHNAGAWFADAIAKYYNVTFKLEKKLQACIATIDINKQICKLVLPTTFMNQSGLPARAISQFYRIMPEEILVIHDELDLAAGRIKLKTGGGHGGHNGLRDIAAQLGSNQFHRLRIGIGHPGHKDMVHNYVLGKPSQTDKQLITNAIDSSINMIDTIINGNMAIAMNQLNS